MTFVLVVAYALSRFLQRQISTPILSLADKARAVSDLHDYSVRAVKHGNDEVGMLTDAFNQMLEQIEDQNKALKESEGRARGILNAAMSAVVVIDTAGRVVEWNARAESMFERARTEALGHDLAGLIIPERHRGAHSAGMKRFHSTGEGPVLNRTIEMSALRRDGAEFPVELSIIPLKTGDVVTFCGFITDITERKESEARIRESLKDITDLKAALDEHAIVATTDPQGKITYVNDKFCAISKYSREELIGQDHRIINSGHHPKEFFRDLWSTIGHGRVWQGEIKNRAKDGSIYWVDTTIVPFLGPDGKPYQYVAIRADVTERKRVEEQLHNLNLTLERHVAERTAQLELANKELEAFSYSVSHDLRAPLRHVDGFAGLLLKSDGPLVSERGRRYLDHIAQSAKQMGTLIDDLLVFSRMGRSEMRITMVDLNKLVDETIHSLRLETNERNVRWVRGDLPVVRGDLPMLRQVYVNLLSNSVKYTRPRDPAVIEIGCQGDSNGEFVFHVRDNGVGFEMEYVHKLFGVFQRLHRSEEFEGTGIGLANVRRIVTRHGGRTWAEGMPDQGATVYFTLPKTSETQS
jgi:PAS domain S-box-containing protein